VKLTYGGSSEKLETYVISVLVRLALRISSNFPMIIYENPHCFNCLGFLRGFAIAIGVSLPDNKALLRGGG
jgi:hypothetical protein